MKEYLPFKFVNIEKIGLASDDLRKYLDLKDIGLSDGIILLQYTLDILKMEVLDEYNNEEGGFDEPE